MRQIESTTTSTQACKDSLKYTIQEHHHTKRNTNYYLVVLDSRIDRSLFNLLHASCIVSDGWYSRKWGNTPGGFAFMDRTVAEEWTRSEFGEPIVEAVSSSKLPKSPTPVNNQAQAFRDLADRLGKDTDAGERRENTPKQRRQASLARANASNAQHAQTAALVIAEALEAGTLPDSLRLIPCTLAGIKKLTARKITSGPGYYDPFYLTDELEAENASGKNMKDYAYAKDLKDWIDGLGKDTGPTPEELKAQAERASVLHEKIPGFFPTPTEAAERMVEAAGLFEEDWTLRILEPSAGRGDLADAIAKVTGPGPIDCIEINPRLRAMVGEKYAVVGEEDFTELDPDDWGTKYDAVLMNPPFENGQDRQHILHAWEFLKPGGVLVAICSPGSLSNTRGNYINRFQRWMADHNVEILDKEVGGFAATKIQAVMLRAYKPE